VVSAPPDDQLPEPEKLMEELGGPVGEKDDPVLTLPFLALTVTSRLLRSRSPSSQVRNLPGPQACSVLELSDHVEAESWSSGL
jgi:hypothetical protein